MSPLPLPGCHSTAGAETTVPGQPWEGTSQHVPWVQADPGDHPHWGQTTPGCSGLIEKEIDLEGKRQDERGPPSPGVAQGDSKPALGQACAAKSPPPDPQLSWEGEKSGGLRQEPPQLQRADSDCTWDVHPRGAGLRDVRPARSPSARLVGGISSGNLNMMFVSFYCYRIGTEPRLSSSFCFFGFVDSSIILSGRPLETPWHDGATTHPLQVGSCVSHQPAAPRGGRSELKLWSSPSTRSYH